MSSTSLLHFIYSVSFDCSFSKFQCLSPVLPFYNICLFVTLCLSLSLLFYCLSLEGMFLHFYIFLLLLFPVCLISGGVLSNVPILFSLFDTYSRYNYFMFISLFTICFSFSSCVTFYAFILCLASRFPTCATVSAIDSVAHAFLYHISLLFVFNTFTSFLQNRNSYNLLLLFFCLLWPPHA